MLLADNLHVKWLEWMPFDRLMGMRSLTFFETKQISLIIPPSVFDTKKLSHIENTRYGFIAILQYSY